MQTAAAAAKILTPAQIAAAARAAGFPESEIPTAVAVAYAESGGNPRSVNKNTNGSTDYGLWQINTIHGPLLNRGDKFNPNDNAKMAYAVWSAAGKKWTPWVVYKTGAFKKYADKGIQGANLTRASGTMPTTATNVEWYDPREWALKGLGKSFEMQKDIQKGVEEQKDGLMNKVQELNPLTPVGDFFTRLQDKALWQRIGIGSAGAAIIILAVIFTFRTQITSTVVKAAIS